MVRIVTGKIDSGKTTRLLEIYKLLGIGDGFIAKKYMTGTDVFGFNLVKLSTSQEYPYMIHDKQLRNLTGKKNEEVFADRIGPYRIYKESLALINNFYEGLIDSDISPLYFDEVGKLEISGKGYYQSIKDALDKNIDIYMTIREDLIEEVMLVFDISEYEIISR